MTGPETAQFAELPSIDRLLNSAPAQVLVAEHGRAEVKRAAREVLASMRAAIAARQGVDPAIEAVCREIGRLLEAEPNAGLRRVINLSGTILHTNLGRALLPREAVDAAAEAMRANCTLEFDLESGRRGERDARIERLLCRLTGAEAATVVNNNAAALMLTLNTLALGRGVPVSRGELVEIGGSFRIPDIIERSGCRLVEVGTTNRTHLRDFSAALGPQTAMILKVHQSNYVIEGFTAAVDERELAQLCRDAKIPLVVDLGSGALIDMERFGLPHEPTPMEALANGADLVTFSGDKMLGGPQAGIILGRRELVERINANPMKRALRCDKMTIAALAALLTMYRHPERLPECLPLLKTMLRERAEIRAQAAPLAELLQRQLAQVASVELVDCDSEVGSGAQPGRSIPSAGIAIRPPGSTRQRNRALDDLAAAFRRLPVPVIGRIHNNEFVLDCRCLEDAGEFAAQLPALDFGR